MIFDRCGNPMSPPPTKQRSRLSIMPNSSRLPPKSINLSLDSSLTRLLECVLISKRGACHFVSYIAYRSDKMPAVLSCNPGRSRSLPDETIRGLLHPPLRRLFLSSHNNGPSLFTTLTGGSSVPRHFCSYCLAVHPGHLFLSILAPQSDVGGPAA